MKTQTQPQSQINSIMIHTLTCTTCTQNNQRYLVGPVGLNPTQSSIWDHGVQQGTLAPAAPPDRILMSTAPQPGTE